MTLRLGQVKCNIGINIFLSHKTCRTWNLSLCLKGQRHCAGTSCSPFTTFIKTTSGIYDKDTREILSHLSICAALCPSIPPPLSVLVAAAGVMDDISQQGFSRRYYHGAGISMEPLGPFPCHRFRRLHDPNLLKGPPDWRNRAMVQALGINFDRATVLHHP